MGEMTPGEADDRAQRKLVAAARESGDPYHESEYFALAEADTQRYWDALIWPALEPHGVDFGCTLELAAGHGRYGEVLRRLATRLILVDINEACVEACRTRFAGDPRVACLRNDGVSLAPIEDGTITFVYCFDSMVHFDSDVIRAYLAEFSRVLRPGGHGFCHHSNYSAHPGRHFTANPHWRNFMSCELFAHYAAKEGLEVLHQRTFDWDDDKALDGLTVFRRPTHTG